MALYPGGWRQASRKQLKKHHGILSFLHVVKDDSFRTCMNEGLSRIEVHKVMPSDI